MKIRVSVGRCSIKVIGTEIQCPFCRTVVRSGQSHECLIAPAIDVAARVVKAKAAPQASTKMRKEGSGR